jgi:DNA-binding transcriptional regulator YdaS (Cro superfamily)
LTDKAGGITALAQLCNVSPPAVSVWVRRNTLPLARVRQIGKALRIAPRRLEPLARRPP